MRLGGRHGGSTTSCFCADPCTHSVQDLNRLLCFRTFWNREIWRFHFPLVHEDHIFFVILAWHVILGTLVAALEPIFTPSFPLEVETGEPPDDQYIHDAMVTSCVFSRCGQTTPLSEQQEVLSPSNFGCLLLLSQGGGVHADPYALMPPPLHLHVQYCKACKGDLSAYHMCMVCPFSRLCCRYQSATGPVSFDQPLFEIQKPPDSQPASGN